jgi:hypothetical protein
MEADQSQALQSASWVLRRANGIVLVQVQRPKSQENQWWSFNSKPTDLRSDVVVYNYNPTYLGHGDWEDCGLRPA